ncbi:MAG: DnaB-like helicase N-terminal domain-containing protein [Thermoleophilia bacterium]
MSGPRTEAPLHFDDEAEKAVLGCLLAPSNNGSRDPGDLKEDHFYSLAHGLIFRAIQEVVRQGVPVDPITVCNWLQEAGKLEEVGGRAFVHSLLDAVYAVTTLSEYASIVRRNARRREEVRIARGLEDGTLSAEQAHRALESLTTDQSDRLDTTFIEWPDFWERDCTQSKWIVEDVLARARGHAIYAPRKEGKSLFMLYFAAKLATGIEPVVVVYLDYEMSEDDIDERLVDMGYGPDTDLSRLQYALLPTLPPLDTDVGGIALAVHTDRIQREWPEHHVVVIIDTIGRATAGPEDKSDTFRDFHRHTGMRLKRRGITWARLDHSGRASDKGPRGSSGKTDDPDVVWQLVRTQQGMTLRRYAARMPWVPEKVAFIMTKEPLMFAQVARDWPAGTHDVAELLDRLDVPIDATLNIATDALKEADQGKRREAVAAALRWRREHSRGA